MIAKTILNIVLISIIVFVGFISLEEQNFDKKTITLLAVAETSTGQVGSTVDISLELKPGSGRIFLATYPLTKFDTQISTRFAKDVACDFVNNNCNNNDFVYEINAKSTIIGGPSAGASIAVLTAAAVNDLTLDKSIAMTGTINSGGLIGPVAGLKEKIEAAASEKIKKVLIPRGTKILQINDTNETTDLYLFGKNLGVQVVEVGDINEAIYEFTGHLLFDNNVNIEVDEEYSSTMELLAEDLCSRSRQLKAEALKFNNLSNEDFKNAIKLYNNSILALADKKYYSSASYCFGANVKFNKFLLDQNFDVSEVEILKKTVKDFEKRIDAQPIRTITDLQAYMIVKERLTEANDVLLNSENKTGLVAYGMERLNSAKSWSKFFGVKGQNYQMDASTLKNSCERKIAEAQERLNYVSFYFPEINSKEKLKQTYLDLENKRYALCLFRSSKAKAEANMIIGLLGISIDQRKSIIDNKLRVVKENIVKELSNGVFPILGYSYFEYANELKESDEQSTLLYSEYALELSDLSLYFKPSKEDKKDFLKFNRTFVFYLIGIFTGFILAFSLKTKKKIW